MIIAKVKYWYFFFRMSGPGGRRTLNAWDRTQFASGIEPPGREQKEKYAACVGQDIFPLQTLTEYPGLGGFEHQAEGDYGRTADQALPGGSGGTAGDEGRKSKYQRVTGKMECTVGMENSMPGKVKRQDYHPGEP